LELQPALEPTASPLPTPRPKKKSLVNRFMRINRLFLLTVALPTTLAVIYFGLMASDVYISESRFVVRSPDRQSASGLGALLKGAGFSRSQDDSYTVHDYVLSRDALKEIDDKLGVGKAFASSQVDIVSRFGGLDFDTSFEALHRYYQKKVDMQQDSASSISTLTVRAYGAQEAQGINQRLLELSEGLVNRLNERGRQDLIRSAASEVAEAETKSKSAALALSAYRNAKGVVDPERQATVQLQQVAKLQDELIATKTQLAQLRAFTPQNPQIQSLQLRAQTLQSEMNAETSKVTGGELSLSNKAADFQRLALEREFADKQLASALASLEQARNEAQRKQVYIERIAQPSLPDVAMEPRRLRSILATFVLGLVAWGILSMLLAGVREHQD
jgi:capsular polysaccharide transport system permease protein